MLDLKITYKDFALGKKTTAGYDTIMDFIDHMEEGISPVAKGVDVDAVFFENPLNTKHFNTMPELLAHCKAITR